MNFDYFLVKWECDTTQTGSSPEKHKGPLINYVILSGGGGRSQNDYIRLQAVRGGTAKDYTGLQGGGFNHRIKEKTEFHL